MSTQLNSSGIKFPDDTTQTTAVTARGLGIDQTWQDFLNSSERELAVNYTNTTGRPIFVSVYIMPNSTGHPRIRVDNIVVVDTDYGKFGGGTVVVPAGSVYRAYSGGGVTEQGEIYGWGELR